MKTVLLDCDGVLLNWRDTFTQWLVKYGIFENADVWDDSKYDCTEFLRLPFSEKPHKNSDYREFLSLVFNDTTHLSKLPPIPHAVEGVKRLHEGGCCLKVVSSFTNEYESMRQREKNLHDVFGPVFQEITCLPLRASKYEYLQRQPKDAYFVEDSVGHIEDAFEVGFDENRLFVIPYGHNANARQRLKDKKLLGIRDIDWRQIPEAILGE